MCQISKLKKYIYHSTLLYRVLKDFFTVKRRKNGFAAHRRGSYSLFDAAGGQGEGKSVNFFLRATDNVDPKK